MKNKIQNNSWELFQNYSQNDDDFSPIFELPKKEENYDEKLDESFNELLEFINEC